MDESRSERLYAERRAILVLDLDRTLVHASCDFRCESTLRNLVKVLSVSSL